MEFVDIDYKPLSPNEESKFNRLREYLVEKQKEGDILYVYRGEELKTLKNRIRFVRPYCTSPLTIF